MGMGIISSDVSILVTGIEPGSGCLAVGTLGVLLLEEMILDKAGCKGE